MGANLPSAVDCNLYDVSQTMLILTYRKLAYCKRELPNNFLLTVVETYNGIYHYVEKVYDLWPQSQGYHMFVEHDIAKKAFRKINFKMKYLSSNG